MKFKCFFVILMFFSLLFSNLGFCKRDFTVGVSPSVVSLGEVEPGTTQVVTFFIVTPSEETLLVDLEPVRGSLDFFNKAGYENMIYNFSEENVVPWVKIINNPVELRPNNETLETKAGFIRGQREISFLLEIPKDTDPGYHLTRIKPIPSTPSGELGTVGTRVIAITTVSVLFNIGGRAVRDGVILETEPSGYSGNSLEIKTYFQNTGTTTISARAKQNIYDMQNNLVAEIYSGTLYFEPEEIRDLKTYLPMSGIEDDEYKVQTTVDFTTGSTQVDSMLDLSKMPEPPKAEKDFFPLLLLILILILLALIIIYRRMK